MYTRGVEAETLDEFDFLAEGSGGRGREVGCGPLPLAQHGAHVPRSIVEEEESTVDGGGPEPQI